MLRKKRSRFRIGMRTVKTVISVIIAMMIVETNISPYTNLSVAMLGAIAAVQPSFKESLESCAGQVLGSIFGLAVGILLLMLPIDHVVATGIAVVLVITVYNSLRISYAPSLPCLMVVILCTTPAEDLGNPVLWSLGRLWDTIIGLGVGLIINTVVFPYDNSRQLRFTVESLDKEVLQFLEEMFDGDDVLPDVDDMIRRVDDLDRQLDIFSKQKLLMHLRRQQKEVELFKVCEGKARELVARIELLSRMGRPGRLTEENRHRLAACGANIQDARHLETPDERDIVINYHVRQILTVRRELLEALGEDIRIANTEK